MDSQPASATSAEASKRLNLESANVLKAMARQAAWLIAKLVPSEKLSRQTKRMLDKYRRRETTQIRQFRKAQEAWFCAFLG
jgi:hypothetical protein